MITANKARELSLKGYLKNAKEIIKELERRIEKESSNGAMSAVLRPPKYWLGMSESYNDYVQKNVFPYFVRNGFNIYFDTLREDGKNWIVIDWFIINE